MRLLLGENIEPFDFFSSVCVLVCVRCATLGSRRVQLSRLFIYMTMIFIRVKVQFVTGTSLAADLLN